mgnify:CR=1 FL=1
MWLVVKSVVTGNQVRHLILVWIHSSLVGTVVILIGERLRMFCNCRSLSMTRYYSVKVLVWVWTLLLLLWVTINLLGVGLALYDSANHYCSLFIGKKCTAIPNVVINVFSDQLLLCLQCCVTGRVEWSNVWHYRYSVRLEGIHILHITHISTCMACKGTDFLWRH